MKRNSIFAMSLSLLLIVPLAANNKTETDPKEIPASAFLVSVEQKKLSNPETKKSRNYWPLFWTSLGAGIGALLRGLFMGEKEQPAFIENKRKSLNKSAYGRKILQTIIESYQDDERIEALQELEEVRTNPRLRAIIRQLVALKDAAHEAKGALFTEAAEIIRRHMRQEEFENAPLRPKVKRELRRSIYDEPVKAPPVLQQ